MSKWVYWLVIATALLSSFSSSILVAGARAQPGGVVNGARSRRRASVFDAQVERQNLVQKYFKKLNTAEGKLKLVGGSADNEGNVEVFHNGRWGSICDDEWDKLEAEVVCRQLGFPGFDKPTHSAAFGPSKRKFWMDNLYCTGREKNLTDCHFDGWGTHDCEATEIAGVVCRVPQKAAVVPIKSPTSLDKLKAHGPNKIKSGFEVRLAMGRSTNEGRVEVRFGGKSKPWGVICGDGWSLLEANVVCQSLGLGYADHAMQTDFFGGVNSSHLLITRSECWGNESSLAKCENFFDYRSPHSCPGHANTVAAVSCVSLMADLVFQYEELESTVHMEDRPMYFLQCAMEENCLAHEAYEIQRTHRNWHLEPRRLLKFTASVLNAGTADFRPHIPKHMWEWHQCHMHYHSMEVFATFHVLNELGERVAEGHKASFCLEDNQCKPGVKQKYFCANYGDQGISVDCYDIYKYNIDCQWVDISDLEHGEYRLRVAINPDFKVPEMSFENNAAVCDLFYFETYARVMNCKLERP